MVWKLFNPCQPCCEVCYRSMIIIAIYDESDPIYTTGPFGSGELYTSDGTDWQNFIDGIEDSHIRMGLMMPQGNLAFSRPPGAEWFGDTDRDEIDNVILPTQTPRVLAENIVEFFHTIYENPEAMDGTNGPELLLFALDNSGSITVGQYAEELAAAKEQLQEQYPDMTILDDVSSAEERYWRDARVGAQDRTCG